MDPKVMIGLEVHTQLNTKTKLFCGCSLENIADAQPNSRTCETCLGHPGSKPKVNRAAVELAIKIALALGCKISEESFFSRKVYLYPDMSKNFQITQYEIPFAKDGSLEIIDHEGKRKTIRIQRMQLEEDPAKLQHVGGNITNADYTLVDYNRSGIGLVEVVTAPDFDTPREARIFLQRLAAILEYLGVLTLGELALKADANISLNGGARVEIKNITGFLEVEKALASEIVRQKVALETKQKIERETRAWSDDLKTTLSLRKKEGEEDYGYIFEPDLPKMEIDKALVLRIEKTLPELPHQKFERYQKEYKITPELASAITAELDLASLFENVARKVDPRFAATWMNILKKTLFYNDLLLKEAKLKEEQFVKLLKLAESGKITDRGAEMVLREIIKKPEKFEELVKGFARVEDAEDIVSSVIKENQKAVQDYKAGNKKSLQFLLGEVIKKSGRRIDAKTALQLLEKKLK